MTLEEEEGQLVLEIERWSKEQGLECESADEMLMNDNLTDHQREWLGDFIERWDELMDRRRTAWLRRAKVV